MSYSQDATQKCDSEVRALRCTNTGAGFEVIRSAAAGYADIARGNSTSNAIDHATDDFSCGCDESAKQLRIQTYKLELHVSIRSSSPLFPLSIPTCRNKLHTLNGASGHIWWHWCAGHFNSTNQLCDGSDCERNET